MEIGEADALSTRSDDAERQAVPQFVREQLHELGQAIRASSDPKGTLREFAEVNGVAPQDLMDLITSSDHNQLTTSDYAESPALPLQLRDQIFRLGLDIQSAADPQGTLREFAAHEGMNPDDLMNLFKKNVQFVQLQQDPSLFQQTDQSLMRPNTLVGVVFKVLSSFALLVNQSAKKHPRSFVLGMSVITFLIYATIMIPRTGMHVSRGTAVFAPSSNYLRKLAESPSLERRPLSIQNKKVKWDDLMLEDDGIEIHKLPWSSELSQAVSAQITLMAEDVLGNTTGDDTEDGGVEDEIQNVDLKNELLDLLFENCANVLAERQWTEFPPSSTKNPLQLATFQRRGVLLVPGLGALGRYGLVRWQVTQQLETHKQACVTLTSLKGDFFDGQIHLEAQRYRSKVLLSVHLAVPRRGRRISKRIASRMVHDLAQSLKTSTMQRTRRSIAQRSVGKRFKEAGHTRANERRQSRHTREKAIEGMSEDRRRRWQRGNPDAGRYRPSGNRQRSPNNC